MDRYAVSHFSNQALLDDLKALVAQDRKTTAILLSRIAEVDERRLFLPAGYNSMHAYCMGELHYSDGATYKRINAARAARAYPILFDALADGRLNLSGIVTLAKRLRPENVRELVAAATHKTREEIELMLAQRFPQPNLPERVEPIAPSPMAPQSFAAPMGELSPGKVIPNIPYETNHGDRTETLPERARRFLAEREAPRQKMTPLAPEAFGLQLTIDRETHELLQRARALMSHQNPSGAIAPVIKRGLELLVAELEKRKYAATDRPRPQAQGTPSNPRHIPASVKRAVRERYGDRCAFVSDGGQRCSSRTRLEFDHIEPVSRGGESTVENLRLLCRAHNLYAAEREFGAEFMEQKRAEARHTRLGD
jgi:hypothetical protein